MIRSGTRCFVKWRTTPLCSSSAVFYVVCFCYASATAVTSQPVQFSATTRLLRLTMDESTSSLFVGAVDNIYQLNADSLQLVNSAITGPVKDNRQCYDPLTFGQELCNSSAKPESYQAVDTHNFNQVLVVDSAHHLLIACGSVFQGVCETRDLSNISQSTTRYSGKSASQNLFVASNDPEWPTVAYQGPGPYNETVLYVATGFYWKSRAEYDIRQNATAISSRSLSPRRKFELVNWETDFLSGWTIGTFAILNDKTTAERFRTRYVDGFTSNGYSYFVKVEPVLAETGANTATTGSKIVQICQADAYYDSYVEMPIICQTVTKNYPIIKAVTLVKARTDLARSLNIAVGTNVLIGAFHSLENETALCMYKLPDIWSIAADNQKHCFSSPTDYVGQQFTRIGSNKQTCTRSPHRIDSNYCGRTDVNSIIAVRNSPLSGNKSVSAEPLTVTNLPNFGTTTVTGVISAAVDQHTVLFLATADGRIVKILLNNVDNPVFDNIQLANAQLPIEQSLVFSQNETHLYALSSNTVYKLSVSQCERYTTCDSCLAAKSPYCGWCTMKAKCTGRSRCTYSNQFARWLTPFSNGSSQCIRINSVLPSSQISVSQNVKVSFQIEMLPTPRANEQYRCVFGSHNVSAVFSSAPNRIECSDITNMAIMSNRSADHVKVMSAVRVLGVNITQIEVTFYNCTAYSSCGSCSSSEWQCAWCVYDNKCVDQKGACSDRSQNPVSDPQFCPRLRSTEEDGDILVQSGSSQTVAVPVSHLPRLYGDKFFCQMTTANGETFELGAQQNNSFVVCNMNQYFAMKSDPEQIQLRIGWRNTQLFDGSANITVFNCTAMSDNNDCSTCHSLQYNLTTSRYNCRWCYGKCQADVNNNCVSSDYCPPATVLSVSPHSGPFEGNTLLTINGQNLGFDVDQVRVTIDGVPCEKVPSEYVVSKRIVCITGPSSKPTDSYITVTVDGIAASWATNSDSHFSYTDPKLFSDISPSVGPVSGGTRVTLNGQYLNTGSTTSVQFANMSTNILMVSEDQLVFLTPRVNRPTVLTEAVVLIDRAPRSSNIVFRYISNPTVNGIVPKSSFQNGGCRVTVHGTGFSCCNDAHLQLVGDYNNFTLTPINRSDNHMTFLSPYVPGVITAAANRRRFRTFVVMDGLQIQLDNFTVEANPQIKPFPNNKKDYLGEILTLEGVNLQTSCMNSQVSVLIGAEPCNITLLTNTSLHCKPPIVQPIGCNRAGQCNSNHLPSVFVKVGNLSFQVGTLQYVGSSNHPMSGWWPVIAGIVGGVLVVAIVLLIIVFMRNSWYNERQYRQLQNQLDALESSVRNECKQAFAELQTEVSDITSEISTVGVPFWDFSSYSYKMLFPAQSGQCLLMPHQTHQPPVILLSDRMHRFNQLLNSKYFLHVFINTLDQQQQSDFTMFDRSRVAAFLMITLMGKMDYVTSVLFASLNQLVDKSVEKKFPKLMLRRMDTIVENMLANWLSLLMYNYLQQSRCGRALFMLYQAIKCQTEKGPIDAVTGEVRYCLSEDRLLRQKIDATVLTLKLELSDETPSGGDSCSTSVITRKLLDCDTISQAKVKALDALYVNTPTSKRPRVEQIDLFWKSGKQGRLPLHDDDVTTQCVSGWKRLNTLGHYHVRDNSTIIVSVRRHTNHATTNADDCDNVLITRTYNGFVELDPGNGKCLPVRLEDRSLTAQRYWHIAKLDEANQLHSTPHSSPQKVISEIFLTRLLSTKMTLQQFIDDLYESIFDQSSNDLPVGIKYLFDFFDSAAKRHNITDPEVVHAWKTNSLPLRFWVNVMKNPELVFDIDKPPIVYSCLTVIAQTFIDSCSTQDHQLTKDSPSNKLLFAKDIRRYRQQLLQFYNSIQQMEPPSEKSVAESMTHLSTTYSTGFNQEIVLKQLYQYAQKYQSQLIEGLNCDQSAKALHLGNRFEQIMQ